METEEAVQKIADAMSDAEGKASSIRASIRATKEAWEALRGNFVIGGLEMQARFRGLDALVTQFEANLFAAHAEMTRRAGELGVDLPQPLSGGR
jgi:hypothetical protein